MTGDGEAIDSIQTRVEQLTDPFESTPFDVFDKRFQASWASFMSRFNDEVESIEDDVKALIDMSPPHSPILMSKVIQRAPLQ